MRNFINENNLDFTVGSRNSTLVTLIGFAQFKGIDKTEFKVELTKEIAKDPFIAEETERLWDYCKKNKYKTWWSTTEAKLQYIF